MKSKLLVVYKRMDEIAYFHPGITHCNHCGRPGGNIVPFSFDKQDSNEWIKDFNLDKGWSGDHFHCVMKVFEHDKEILAQIHQFIIDHPDLALEI